MMVLVYLGNLKVKYKPTYTVVNDDINPTYN